MGELQTIMNRYEVALEELARVRRRVFIVGRFSCAETAADKGEEGTRSPGVYCFWNRAGWVVKDNPEYAANFARGGLKQIDYRNFLDLLKPTLAERFEGTSVQLAVAGPPSGMKSERTITLRPENYLDVRSAATTEQPAFQEERPQLQREFFAGGDETHRGKVLFDQVRHDLETLCRFQHRVPELPKLFSEVLGRFQHFKGIPGYLSGAAFPEGLPELLIDLLYDEDPRARFDVKRLLPKEDTKPKEDKWKSLADFVNKAEKDCKAGEEPEQDGLSVVVQAFRDRLIGGIPEQYDGVRVGGQSVARILDQALRQHAGLIDEFRRSRDSFLMIREVLESKFLLYMVLEWVLNSYWDLECVRKAEGQEQQQAEALHAAITRDWKKWGLARKIERLPDRERAEFNASLYKNWERVLDAVNAPSKAEADRIKKELPERLQREVDRLREDEGGDLRKVVGALSGREEDEKSSDGSKEYESAFKESWKSALFDIVCPLIHREPKLTRRALHKLFRRELFSCYLTAVSLQRNLSALEAVAERQVENIERIVSTGKRMTLDDWQTIADNVVVESYGLLTKADVAATYKESHQTLGDIHWLLENAAVESKQGASRISAVRPHKGATVGFEAVERTDPSLELVEEAAPVIAKSALKALGITPAMDRESAHSPAEDKVHEEARALPSEGLSSTVRLTATSDESSTASDVDEAVSESGETGPFEPSMMEMARKIAEGLRSVEEETVPLEKVARKVTQAPELRTRMRKSIETFQRAMHLIHCMYRDHGSDRPVFKAKVERLALIQSTLLLGGRADLGQNVAFLYELLLDLVGHVGPGGMRQFMKEVSLTKFFNEEQLACGGIGEIRNLLRTTHEQALSEVSDYFSELRGVKYLMDSVKGIDDVEIIVVNATAEEFTTWLGRDNLEGDVGDGLLRVGHLKVGHQTIQPGLVVMTGLAFPRGGPGAEQWLRSLGQMSLRAAGAEEKKKGGRLAMVLPPICLSTKSQSDPRWETTGKDLASAAEGAPCPVLIVGPAAALNKPSDQFKTYVPASVLLAAHFLGAASTGITFRSVNAPGGGRFQVIGSPDGAVLHSLDAVLFGKAQGAEYALAADYYLYTLLLILANAETLGMNEDTAKEYFRCFEWQADNAQGETYPSSSYIDDALLGGASMRFRLGTSPKLSDSPSADLSTVEYRPGKNPAHKSSWSRLEDVRWFNSAREKLRLTWK